MQYYAEMKFYDNFDLLIGVENKNIIFSHTFKNKKEKLDVLSLEKKFVPGFLEFISDWILKHVDIVTQ